MAGLLLTVDDQSPLITFQPPSVWTEHNTSTDPIDASKSFGETFRKASQTGATMSFTFEGVGVTVYGTKGVDHGNYTINLDGQNYYGQGVGPPAYQFPIFVANYSLLPGTHTLTMLTRDNSTFVIDYITWVSSIDTGKNGSVDRNVIDDADPGFHYRQGDWSKPMEAALFYGGSGQ
ncbi:hypothetical protein H0H87_006308 [Tephrocybe sp. NHM501043]|nr:hypothetical protein H0H87_006308 [Tephrocybe sp. NHM501043]